MNDRGPRRHRSAAAALLLAVVLGPAATSSAQTVAPDGRIAFSSDADGDWDIWTMAPDGTAAVNLTSEGESGDGWIDTQPSWSPDGSRIAFTSTRGAGDDGDIYVMDADGSNLTPVTSNTDPDYQPDWSPDGTRLVFTSERADESPNDSDDGDIYVIDADGTNEVNVTDPLESRPGQFQWYDKDPDWSPVADRIVFSSARIVDGSSTDGAYWRIVTMRPDGSDQTIVSDPDDPGNDPWPDEWPNHDEMPKWSPDGRWITFATHQQPEQQWDVQIVRADGTDQQNVLPAEEWEDLYPTWSSSGTEILFTSNRTGDHTRAIYSVDVSAAVGTQATREAATRAGAPLLRGSTTETSAIEIAAVEPVGGVGRSFDPDHFGRLRCTIRGTAGPDQLVGTPMRDVICAGGGADVIDALRGPDVVYGGGGDDAVLGRAGRDVLFGHAGGDRLNGGLGSDVCSDPDGTSERSCEV